MGALADKAKQQSNFLIIDKGHKVLVRYLGYRFVPSKLDPSRDVVQYKVNEGGKDKYWDNGSSRIMLIMDKVKTGSWVLISRAKWINKDGTENAAKSSYDVKLCDELGNVVGAQPEVAPEVVAAATGEEKAWDE